MIDLLSLNDTSLKREFKQFKKLKERLKLIWTNFHRHYSELVSEIDEILIPVKRSRNGWPNRKARNKLTMSTEKVCLFSVGPFV